MDRPVERDLYTVFGNLVKPVQSLSKIEFFGRNGKYPSFISSSSSTHSKLQHADGDHHPRRRRDSVLPARACGLARREQVRIPWRLLGPFTQLRHRQACRRRLCEQVGALSGQGVCVPLRRQGPQLRRQARRRRLCEQVGARGGQGATSTRLQAGEQFCSASPEPAGLAFAGRCSTLCWLYALNLQLAWLR